MMNRLSRRGLRLLGIWGMTGVVLAAWRAGGAVQSLAEFQAGNGGWHLGTLAVGNIDGDGQQEIVVPYRDRDGLWHLDAYKWNGTHIAGFPYNSLYEEMNTSPTLVDLDNDGRQEILFTRGAGVVALRGDGSTLWSSGVNFLNYIPQAGFMTPTNGFYLASLATLGLFQPTLPPTAIFSSQVSSPMVVDLAGNGIREVVTAWKIDPDGLGSDQDYNPFINDIWGFGEWGTVGEVWSGGVMLHDARTGAQNLVYHLHTLVEAGLGVGKAKAGASKNVYVLNDSDSIVSFDRTRPHGFEGKGMLHKKFGKNLRMTTGFYQQGIDVYPVDLDGDGLDEVLSPTTQFNCLWQPHETVLDDDGALLWREWKEPVDITNVNGWFNNAGMIPVNPDHDNRIDVLSFTHSYQIHFRSWNGVDLVERPGWPKNFFPLLPTPPVVGDVDGDGREEIVIGTYDPARNPSTGSLQVFALDGTLKETVPVPGGLKHVPFLADVNGDGKLDVVYRSLAGRVYVKNFGATGTNLVSWATHRGNAQRDGKMPLFPAGTPIINRRENGGGQVSFGWSLPAGSRPDFYRIYRAESAQGPFLPLVTLGPGAAQHVDLGLAPGQQYVYEVAAVTGLNSVRSAPFALLSLFSSNLVENAGFEENENSHWDKWDTGDLSWNDMVSSTQAPHGGKKSMAIHLRNQGSTDTLNQYVQYGISDGFIPVQEGVLYSFGGFWRNDGLSGPTRQWLEWTSSLTAENHTARPPLPWPNYFTPELTVGTGASDWVYQNRVFVMPPGIPNVELRHRLRTDQPVTGTVSLDDLFFRALPSPANPRWQRWLPFGASWRYAAGTPPENWAAPRFVDMAWPLGRAKFGRGSGTQKVATSLPSNQSNYFFRTTVVRPAGSFGELLLAATCTDRSGDVTYPLRLFINGREVITSGIDAVSGTGNEVLYFDLTPFLGWFQPGPNVVAVQLQNAFQEEWDNVAFDVSFLAMPDTANPVRLSVVPAPPGMLGLQVETPPGSWWALQTSDGLNQGWKTLQTFTAPPAQPIQVPKPASGTSQRFYRLEPF